MNQAAKDELLRWLGGAATDAGGQARQEYLRNHGRRLCEAFAALPPLPTGFSCLLLGSWGDETPYLMGVLGAGRVTAVRAPDRDVPEHEERRLRGPGGEGPFRCDAYALDLERQPIPEHLTGFDLTLLWEVVEHLHRDPAFALWQGVRSLKIGGRISVTTPNALWYEHTVNHLAGRNSVSLKLRQTYAFSTHWREYAPCELADLLRAQGCEVLRADSLVQPPLGSIKARITGRIIERLRRGSGNGPSSLGRHAHVIAQKTEDRPIARPAWLYPA